MLSLVTGTVHMYIKGWVSALNALVNVFTCNFMLIVDCVVCVLCPPDSSRQNLLKSTGGSGKPTVFLITDAQIKEESFLEDIDALLNTGEVPNLFAPDEKAELLEVSSRLFPVN